MKVACCAMLATMLVAGSSAYCADLPYLVSSRLAVGGDGGWDYPSIEPGSRLLYLSRANRVTIVDTSTGTTVAEIPEADGVHGIAFAPELNRGYISCGKANVIKVFDLKTHAVVASIATGENPDAVLYEPKSKRVLSFNGRGKNVTVIDAGNNSVVATIAVGGKPEFAQDDGRGRIFVNIEDTAELVEIDAAAASVKNRWKLPHCEEPTGLAVDAAHRRAFSTCGNEVLAVTNMDSGKAVASVAIGKGVDGAVFDPVSQDVITANGEAGNATIVHEADPDHYQVLQTLVTQRGARTITLDPLTRRMFLPTAKFGPAPVATAELPHPRPAVLPGSFVVLVVEPGTK